MNDKQWTVVEEKYMERNEETFVECKNDEIKCGNYSCIPKDAVCCADVGYPNLYCDKNQSCTAYGTCVDEMNVSFMASNYFGIILVVMVASILLMVIVVWYFGCGIYDHQKKKKLHEDLLRYYDRRASRRDLFYQQETQRSCLSDSELSPISHTRRHSYSGGRGSDEKSYKSIMTATNNSLKKHHSRFSYQKPRSKSLSPTHSLARKNGWSNSSYSPKLFSEGINTNNEFETNRKSRIKSKRFSLKNRQSRTMSINHNHYNKNVEVTGAGDYTPHTFLEYAWIIFSSVLDVTTDVWYAESLFCNNVEIHYKNKWIFQIMAILTIIIPMVLNLTLSFSLISRRLKASFDFLNWYRTAPGAKKCTSFFVLFSIFNIELLSILVSGLWNLPCFSAPLGFDDFWFRLKFWGFINTLVEDIPQFLIQFLILYPQLRAGKIDALVVIKLCIAAMLLIVDCISKGLIWYAMGSSISPPKKKDNNSPFDEQATLGYPSSYPYLGEGNDTLNSCSLALEDNKSSGDYSNTYSKHPSKYTSKINNNNSYYEKSRNKSRSHSSNEISKKNNNNNNNNRSFYESELSLKKKTRSPKSPKNNVEIYIGKENEQSNHEKNKYVLSLDFEQEHSDYLPLKHYDITKYNTNINKNIYSDSRPKSLIKSDIHNPQDMTNYDNMTSSESIYLESSHNYSTYTTEYQDITEDTTFIEKNNIQQYLPRMEINYENPQYKYNDRNRNEGREESENDDDDNACPNNVIINMDRNITNYSNRDLKMNNTSPSEKKATLMSIYKKNAKIKRKGEALPEIMIETDRNGSSPQSVDLSVISYINSKKKRKNRENFVYFSKNKANQAKKNQNMAFDPNDFFNKMNNNNATTTTTTTKATNYFNNMASQVPSNYINKNYNLYFVKDNITTTNNNSIGNEYRNERNEKGLLMTKNFHYSMMNNGKHGNSDLIKSKPNYQPMDEYPKHEFPSHPHPHSHYEENKSHPQSTPPSHPHQLGKIKNFISESDICNEIKKVKKINHNEEEIIYIDDHRYSKYFK